MIVAPGALLPGPPWALRAGTVSDIDAVKAIADREKRALGFVHRGSLVRAAARGELVVATMGTAVAGFCQLYRRRDGIVSVYHIAVMPEARGTGIGRALLADVGGDAGERGMAAVRLKCPADLPANEFYRHLGFRLVSGEAGAARPLNVWEYRLADGEPVSGPGNPSE